MSISRALREAAQVIVLLDAAMPVIAHCLDRGTPAPDPLDLRSYAEAWADWLRDASELRLSWIAASMCRSADQLDAAADRLWLAMLQRGS